LHNQHVTALRRARREGIDVSVGDMTATLTVEPTAGAAMLLHDLKRAIAALPEEQRQAILLVGLEGMRYEDVAKILAISVDTVRSRLSRGREMLRKLMEMEAAVDGSPGGRAAAPNPAGPQAASRAA
jgi:RNA polymerase sigma-70 factor, ECF subfamily